MAHIVVFDDTVSRRHAAIVHHEASTFIYDLGSTHGTFVNNKKIDANEPVELENGVTISVGKAPEIWNFNRRKPVKKKRPREEAPQPIEEPTESIEPVVALPESGDVAAAVAYDPFSAIFKKGGAGGGGGGGGFSWADALK